MNKKVAGIISIITIIVCIAYIVYDIATGKSDIKQTTITTAPAEILKTNWQILKEVNISFGNLTSVALTEDDQVICAGESFLAGYNINLSQTWGKSLKETINPTFRASTLCLFPILSALNLKTRPGPRQSRDSAG